MKKIVLSVFFIFFVCGTSPLRAETVIMDNYDLDYHIGSLLTVYEGYSIYELEIVDINTGEVSYGLLAINPSPVSYFPFIIIGLADSKYLSFTIQGYWEGNGSIGYLSTNTYTDVIEVQLSLGEQRW